MRKQQLCLVRSWWNSDGLGCNCCLSFWSFAICRIHHKLFSVLLNFPVQIQPSSRLLTRVHVPPVDAVTQARNMGVILDSPSTKIRFSVHLLLFIHTAPLAEATVNLPGPFQQLCNWSLHLAFNSSIHLFWGIQNSVCLVFNNKKRWKRSNNFLLSLR